ERGVLDWDRVLRHQREMTELLWVAGGDDPIKATQAVGAAMGSHRAFALTPGLDLAPGRNEPRITFAAQNLLGFMLMEVAEVAAKGARTTSCQHCSDVFTTGPTTHRRSHAKYCSEKCR